MMNLPTSNPLRNCENAELRALLRAFDPDLYAAMQDPDNYSATTRRLNVTKLAAALGRTRSDVSRALKRLRILLVRKGYAEAPT